jgi:acetyl-CoA acyltransferase
MKNVVIAGYARSPFTLANKGALTRVRPDDLAAQVVAALIERTKVRPQDIEDVIVGCAFPEGEQGFNVGRLIGLLAGLPQSVAGMTVNRFAARRCSRSTSPRARYSSTRATHSSRRVSRA